MDEMVSSATLLASARIVCTALVNFLNRNKKIKKVNLIVSVYKMIYTYTNLLYLVVIAIKFRDNGNERKSHDGHQCELPGHPKHEDEDANALDGAL